MTHFEMSETLKGSSQKSSSKVICIDDILGKETGKASVLVTGHPVFDALSDIRYAVLEHIKRPRALTEPCSFLRE